MDRCGIDDARAALVHVCASGRSRACYAAWKRKHCAVGLASAHCSVYLHKLSPFLSRPNMSASTVSSYDGERRKPKGAVLFTGTLYMAKGSYTRVASHHAITLESTDVREYT